jgi:hypothetical protein
MIPSVNLSEDFAYANTGVAERRERTDRRSLTARTILRGMFRGRRQGNRRDGEVGTAWSDFYGVNTLLTSAAIVILCCADAFLTLTLVAHGGKELNPLMDMLLGVGPDAFINMKIALTSICVILLVALQNVPLLARFRVFHLMLVLLAGYAALIAYELTLLS